MNVRREREGDADAIRAVHRAAFGGDDEALLVDRLRARGAARIALVAEIDGDVVAHVCFSPAIVVAHSGTRCGLGLAPLGVMPAHQRSGLGSALTREGLSICRRDQCPFVVVLGEPAYYARFGFEAASRRGLRNEFGADDAFQVLELERDSLPRDGGLVKYDSEFDAWRSAPS